MHYTYLDSPIGDLLLAGDDEGLKVIAFPKGKGSREPDPDWMADERPFEEVKWQLKAYFRGELKKFDIKLCPDGTQFQLDVLTALLKIPYGETRSYGELAADLGRPNSSRAVGGANGRNPLPIVIPCHRVIGSDGSLTGFGGGVETKRYLLELEGGMPQHGLGL